MVELKLTLTPDEAKTILDALMSMRKEGGYIIPMRADDAPVEYPITPPPPPTMGNVPAPVPSVVPTTGPSPVTVSGPVDARGVIWHPDHHSGKADAPGANDDGSWKKRRGHDPEALKAYETGFLGKSSASEVIAAADAPTVPATPPVLAGVSDIPPPPPPPGTPGVVDVETLWAKLVTSSRMNADIEAWFVSTYGGHPVNSDVLKVDPVKRLNAYNQMKYYAA